jgi:hypothetical protein
MSQFLIKVAGPEFSKDNPLTIRRFAAVAANPHNSKTTLTQSQGGSTRDCFIARFMKKLEISSTNAV